MLRGPAVFAVIAALQMAAAAPLAAEPAGRIQLAQAYGGFPPQEMAAIVRSIGLRPITAPVRQGPTYVLRAIDRRGEERRVVIDARYGEVIEAIPVVREPAYPGSRVVRLPDREPDEFDVPPPGVTPPAVVPGPRDAPPAPRATVAPAPRVSAAPPQQPAGTPVPRPRPNTDSQTAAAPPAPAAPVRVIPLPTRPVEQKPAEPAPVESKPAEAKPKVFVPDAAPLD